VKILGKPDLSGADLLNAELFGADLHDAALKNANFYQALLQNANLSGANLEGCHLREPKHGSMRLNLLERILKVLNWAAQIYVERIFVKQISGKLP
jgi:uncharacterized protein YjbI with pentapeptide repeats